MAPAFEEQPHDNDLLGPSPKTPGKKRIAVVTGSRAEFGLLRPVMTAIAAQPTLELAVIAAGSHLLLPANTVHEVKQAFRVGGVVPMQQPGKHTRIDDAEALGRGIARFARTFYKMNVDCVVVLGDRIEAFAAAAAASVGGVPLAHIHGGDRAEGVADEAMRHAITKLAHIHFPATRASADRIARLGEPQSSIHVVGSPAIDGLSSIGDNATEVGNPEVVILHHPCGLSEADERAHAAAIVGACKGRVLVLAPNHDPGRLAVMETLRSAAERNNWLFVDHLPRERFVAVLKHLAKTNGVLIGNSSAGLIEAAAIGCKVVNVGPRQAGRESAANAIHVPNPSVESITQAIATHRSSGPCGTVHPYGDGQAGPRIAGILAQINLDDPALLRKRCTH
jgi:UDP-hydrolysing UDP-N-acetyl-D-glucosamine 2-epimerase